MTPKPKPLAAASVLACLVSAAVPVRAAGSDPLPLSLADAVGRALAAAPGLAARRAQQAGAEAALRGARAERAPSVAVSGAYMRNSNVPELRLTLPNGETQTLFPNIPNTSHARADLTLALYTGGRVSGGIQAADSQRLAALSDVKAGSADVVLEASRAYWSLVAARESERVLREGIASYEAHLVDARNLMEQGMVARNDVLAVEVARDRAELARLEAASQRDTANADLERLLALPPATRIEPTEPIQAPPSGAQDLESLVATAVAARPELLALRARLEAAQAAVKVAGAARLPQAALLGGFQYADPNLRILPLKDEWQSDWSIGVSVSLNVFDAGRTGAAVAEARSRVDVIRADLEELERSLRFEVTTRSLELATAEARLQVASHSLESARENVRVSQDRYREGVSPSSDLLDAETALLRAGLDRSLAAAEIRVARAGLERAVGN
jgi:outer membrane protein